MCREFYSEKKQADAAGSSGHPKPRVVILNFVSFNGISPVVFGGTRRGVLGARDLRLGALAKNLDADYLVEIEFDPEISKLDVDPEAPNEGLVWVTYRARIWEASGLLLSDSGSPHEILISKSVKPEISDWHYILMELARVVLLFPTESQRAEIITVESRLMPQVFDDAAVAAAAYIITRIP